MNLKDSTILYLGLSPNEVDSVCLLEKLGARVLLYSRLIEGPQHALTQTLQKQSKSIELLYGDFPIDFPPLVDQIILSGPRETYETILAVFEKQQVPVLSPLDLVIQNLKIPYLGITGTNGKSTTAKILQLMLQTPTRPVFLGGGEAAAFLELLDSKKKHALAVLELSSTKLKNVKSIHPSLSIIPNLAASHFERHSSLKDYFESKARIFVEQNSNEFLIFPGDNPYCLELLKNAQVKQFPVYLSKPAQHPGLFFGFFENNQFCIYQNGELTTYPSEKRKLRGPHNVINFLCAIAAAQLLKANPTQIQSVIDTFEGLAHRMQLCLEKNGLRFYDDSRAYNPVATSWGISGFRERIILILGGMEAWADYTKLKPIVSRHVKLLFIIGEARNRIFSQLKGATETYLVETLDEAVALAMQKSQKGDCIVLSPAAAPEPHIDAGFQGRSEHFLKAIQKQLSQDTHQKRQQDRLNPLLSRM